ncbi:putative acetyltransferase [Jannaschia faecimaris]|uniref:Putative acetyltransferase n=1 Tax=Jannaschia faecimaris TaxID=1244108 RepID=A0A1H3QT55_9RHOB|nr:N-acetyltransferase [Jannaschia faecimaris]SDZ16520.1 putative acetyltransferase [Jannaschia faecimaris]
MTASTDIRPTDPADLPGLMALYARAFPEEDLTGTLIALLAGDWPVMSLVAAPSSRIFGHILFTRCGTGQGDRDGTLLAPLAVDPEHQGRGIGTALVQDAFSRLTADGVRQVFVLGDPGYYARFGFAAEDRVVPPYPLPSEWAAAWQSRCLEGAAALGDGPLHLPAPWCDPLLWRP